MKFYHFGELDIIRAIQNIDKLLVSLQIKPVLNYKAIEYRLDCEGRPLMIIKLEKHRLGIEPRYVDGNRGDKIRFEQIESSVLKILTPQQ